MPTANFVSNFLMTVLFLKKFYIYIHHHKNKCYEPEEEVEQFVFVYISSIIKLKC